MSCHDAIIGGAASNQSTGRPSTKGIFEISTNISFSNNKNLRSIWALSHVLMRDMQRAYISLKCVVIGSLNSDSASFRPPGIALRLRFTLLQKFSKAPARYADNQRASHSNLASHCLGTMASKNETTPLVGGGDGHKRSDSQPSYYFLQRTASLQRTESAMKERGAVVELPPEGASSAEFNSRPVAVRFPCFG